MLTLKQLAQQAIDVQDACNINVVHGWSEVLQNLRWLMPSADTTTINRHPINKMWAYKAYSLACGEPIHPADDGMFRLAYEWCQEQTGTVRCRFCRGDEMATACECV